MSQTETVDAVAVDPKTDLVAVTTFENPESGPPEIVFFKHGASTPCNVVQASAVAQIFQNASFDASGTLYFGAADGQGREYLASTSGGCSAKNIQTYALPDIVRYLGDIAFNFQDNLVLQDFLGLPVPGPLYTFAHPRNGKIGKLLSKTTLDPLDKSYTPGMVTMTSDGKHLWAIAYPPGPTNYMAEYNYPQGGAPIKLLHGIQQPITAAVFPNYVP